MKFPNLLIIILILFTLSVTSWFIWRDFSNPQISGDPIISVVNFQERAMELVNAPVVFRSEFPEEIKKDLQNQIKDLQEKIRVNYDDLSSWVSFGQLKKVIGDYGGAKEAWEFGGLIRPENDLSFHNLGELYGTYLNNIDKAEENYLFSIKNNPENIAGYINLAEILWNTGEKKYQDKLPELLSGGLEDNFSVESRVPLLGRLAKYYSDIGDYRQSIYYYEEVLKIDTTYEDIIGAEIERLSK